MRTALVMLAAMILAGSMAARAEVKLVPEYDPQTKLGIVIQGADEFRSRLRIGVLSTAKPSADEVRAIIEKYDVRTKLGKRVVDLFFEPGSGGFVGIDSGSIDFSGHLPDGSVVVSTKDADGQFNAPGRASFAWTDSQGQPQCFDLADLRQLQSRMSFTFLLDRSGSMLFVSGDVADATRNFLSVLPPDAECSIVSFARDSTNLTPGRRQRCGDARLKETLTSGGSTDIYTPLAAALREYRGPAYDGWQKAIILISDGAVTNAAGDPEAIKQQLIATKGDTRLFVFWLGLHTERYLAGLADYFISNDGEAGAYLDEVYGAIGEAYTKQQVLRPRACTP